MIEVEKLSSCENRFFEIPKVKSKLTQENQKQEQATLKASAWTVMGGSSSMPRKRSNKSSINKVLPSSSSSYLLFAFVLWGLLSLASSRQSKTCSVDRCSDVFRSVEDADTDLERCKKLRVHKRCLSRMKKVCRGNLMYHSNVHINKSRMKITNCDEVFKNESMRPPVEKQTASDKQTCVYEKKNEYKFCGVFGDPHIRTFSDDLITCKTNGSWTLVENEYIVVMATNAIVSHHTGATATVKLTVIVKEFEGCVNMSTYSADVSRPLPLTFIDGSTTTGTHRSTNITQLKSEDGVEILLRHISTTVIVRKIGGHLTFAITMPEEFVKASKQRQMCINGCPKEMQISHPELLNKIHIKNSKPFSKLHPKFNEEQAREYCRKAMLEELKPCVEDALNRRRRGTENPKKSRSKKEVTPSLMIAETISISEDKRSRYSREDAAVKSWKQLSSRTDNVKKNKGRRKHRNKNRKGSKNNKPLADEPRDDNTEEKLRKFNEKTKQKASLENNIIKNETNFYFEACVFDLRTTGDITYAKSARAAFDDVTKMHSKKDLAPSASKTFLCKVDPFHASITVPPTIPQRDVGENKPPGGSAFSAQANLSIIITCSLATTLLFNFNFILVFILSLVQRSLFNSKSAT